MDPFIIESVWPKCSSAWVYIQGVGLRLNWDNGLKLEGWTYGWA